MNQRLTLSLSKTCCAPSRVLVMVVAAVSAFTTTAGGLTIDDYRAQVESQLPTYNTGLLAVQDGTDWIASVGVNTVASAVGDFPPPDQIVQQGPLIYAQDAGDTKFVKLDFSRGFVRWGNHGRRFDFMTFPHTAVSVSLASQAAVSVADALGVPSGERGQLVVDTIMEGPYGAGGPGTPYQRERLVTMDRVVNGHRVYESKVRMSVSNLGEPSRLLVTWPRMIVPAGLTLAPRPTVVEAIAQRMWNLQQGDPVDLSLEIAYARFGSNFVPAVIAGIVETATDTGHFGETVVVPLVVMSPDRDRDGIPDATDNCPERSNPNQADADGDGVGDRCDNCAETSNPSQSDVNQDGFGDVCQQVEGACRLPDGTCETLMAGTCAEIGGTYLGDGTTCASVTDAPLPEPAPRGSLDLRTQPNPAIRNVEVQFSLDATRLGQVTVDVFDARGARVRKLLSSEIRAAGPQHLVWDGRDDERKPVAAGTYFVRIQTSRDVEMRKVTLLR